MSEFLAEARILVRPDTTKFRAELEAQLKAATSKPLVVPVTAAVTSTNVTGVAAAAQASASAQKSVAAASQEAGAAAQTAAVATVKLSAAQKAAATAAELLALAQSNVVGDLSAVGSAQVTLTRSSAALSAAQKAVGTALRGNNAALVSSGEATLALAADQVVQAKSALSAARAETVLAASTEAAAAANAAAAAAAAEAAAAKAATVAQAAAAAAALKAEAAAAREAAAAQAAHASSLSQLTRGAGASGLTLFGLRGATLAASGAFLAGTAAVVGFAKALQSAAQLETELNVFKVTAGATADEMDRVSASAKQLGRDITLPGVTAGDAATAMTELAKAGLSVQDSMLGARGALQLATAAQIDNVTATKLVAGALNAFQLSGNEAVKVADLLTGAANESQGEISDMGTALSQAAAVANLFGVSVGDTVTLLTELAQAGIAGGRAGTSLRVAFLRLVNPPKAAAKILKELNVQIRDIKGNLRPEIFTDIQKALEGYTKAQQQAKLATIFGSDAIRAAAIIGAKGTQGFKDTNEAINEFGLAQRQAAARTSGLQGDLENLSNQASSLGLTIGEVAKGPLGSFVKETALVVGALSEGVAAAAGFGAAVKGLGGSIAGSIPFLDKFLAVNKEITEVLLLGPALGFAKLGADIARSFGDGADKIKADATDIRAEILSIVATGQKTGGDLGLNEALVSLDLLVERLNKGGPAAQKFASEVAGIRTELQKAGTTGFKLFPDDVTKLFPPDLLTGAVARKAGEENKDALEAALPGRDLFSFTKASFDNVTKAIEVSGNEAAAAARRVFGAIVAASQEQLAKIGESFDVAVAGDSTSGQLAALKKQAAEQQEIIDAANKAAKAAGAGNKGFATAVAQRRKAQHDLASVNQQIRGIETQIASDAEQTANDVKTARDKANQAFLDALGGRQGNLENAVLAAQATKSLNDDIARNKALRAFFVRSRDEAAKTITDAKLKLQTVQAFTKDIINVTKTIADLKQQQIQAQKEAQRQRQDALEASLNLDIDFAQTTGSRSGEIKAREALIKQLKKEQDLTKRGTNEWKNLRNDIAEQNAAIAALRKEKQKQGQSFAQASFDFLQTQQGFASSLLGNLIPGGATGGLVGGGQGPVQSALAPVAGLADGQSKSGPTSGQANASLHALNQIVQQLKILNGDNRAPEAAKQNWLQKATMDY